MFTLRYRQKKKKFISYVPFEIPDSKVEMWIIISFPIFNLEKESLIFKC